MFIGLTDEQLQLRAATRTLMTSISSEAQVRQVMAATDGGDVAGWRQLCGLGLVGLAVPERFGGGNGSFVDQGVVLEELGRALYCGPYLNTAVFATQTLLAVGDGEVAEELLRGICDSGLVVTVALTEPVGQWDEAGVRLSAANTSSGWRLTGVKTFVPDGATADVTLVVARTGKGTSLFAVPAQAERLRRLPLPTMDQTRKQARLEFDATPGRLIGSEGDAWSAIERGLQMSAVALAAEQVGGAQFVLEMTVDHARSRTQFGRPIGSFQAIQHKCATLLLDVEAARSAAYYGLAAGADQSAELPAVASVAKAFCSETYRRTTNEAIQVLGGMGLTWEHPIHLYFKRARSSEVFLGTPAYHRELLARHLRL